ncbi:cation transporter [Pochonia chlamydosporia 170]|uniref:Cation transporter n=1 Tax=Pochonia chlamydosporia 170 TaxID=1380566 RepID=A0A179FI19_METCM|nr:cation transporter [Pochonia chlamydosporia 170]OAQ65206.1 cation transporter [Pochonia chlamydosporia 170]
MQRRQGPGGAQPVRSRRGVVRLGISHIDFISIHYVYFIIVPLLCSIIFWASSDPEFSISYTDSLFLVVSAITEAGLNTVDLSRLTTWQQILLCLLILFGSAIWVSIWLIVARRRSIRRLLETDCLNRLGNIRREEGQRVEDSSQHAAERSVNVFEICNSDGLWLRQESVSRNATCDVATGITQPTITPGTTASKEASECIGPDCSPLDFLTNKSVDGRGHFINLTSEERLHVLGIEHDALTLLSLVVPLYFILWQLLGCLGLGAWIANNLPGPAVANGINPWWLGIFNGVSAFNNSGMSLLDANVVPYQGAYYVLITMSLLILVGNTAYPIILRLIFWVSLHGLRLLSAKPRVTKWKLTVEYILRYPRRVSTNLFPACHTWWLVFMVLLLNGIDWAAFELLNIGNPVITAIPVGPRLLDAVRSGGFYVVPIAKLHIGLLVLYVIMMYISAFPVIITMRHSNIYAERSIGTYTTNAQESDINGSSTQDGTATESGSLFISQQIKGQLARDIWLLALAIFIISVIEASHFREDPVSYSVFNIIFEVVSAYGCVGISVGLPSVNYSFCGGWHSGSKLVLCLVMLGGRHRGLPAAMDHAVRLAGKHLHWEEQEDGMVGRIVSPNWC